MLVAQVNVQPVTSVWKRDIKCAFEDVKKELYDMNKKTIEVEKKNIKKDEKAVNKVLLRSPSEF